MKGFEVMYLNGWLGRAVTRVVGKPGSLRFRLARDTLGVMVKKMGCVPIFSGYDREENH